MHHLGHTRSANRRDHLLLTPDTFVRTPLPGLTGGVAIVHTAPQVGAGFTMTTVELEPHGTLREGPAQRFVYVLEGDLKLAQEDSSGCELTAGSFAYMPSGDTHVIEASTKSRIVMIEKYYAPLKNESAAQDEDESERPEFFVGHESDVASTALNDDEGLQVRALVPSSAAFDFACNTMMYQPGAALNQVEIHYMEHGLLMLEGGGIYRLGDEWYPTQAGDFIWMAPFCPQWFGAIGKQPAKYLIYKDFNRHTLA